MAMVSAKPPSLRAFALRCLGRPFHQLKGACSMSHTIEDYAMSGDCRTAALVARDGAIEWLCLPSFDAPACFAKLLGEEEHGYWRIATQDAKVDITRAYRGDGLILETEHKTAKGKVRVIDFMPTGTEHPQIVRLVEGLAGEVEMRME